MFEDERIETIEIPLPTEELRESASDSQIEVDEIAQAKAGYFAVDYRRC